MSKKELKIYYEKKKKESYILSVIFVVGGVFTILLWNLFIGLFLLVIGIIQGNQSIKAKEKLLEI